MNIPESELLRLQFLVRVVQKEIQHLQITDKRLFAEPFTSKQAGSLGDEVELAERVDAFVSRFGRLQDTVGDKMLPHYLTMLGESTGAAIDNLNRAEKLGLIGSTDIWLALRNLRNQMIHEYIEDSNKLASALNKGHEHVTTLTEDAKCILADIAARGWLEGL